ncbi:MAG: MFS transporter [Bacillota bacterium]
MIDRSNKHANNDRFDWLKLFIISISSIAVGIYRDGFSVLFPFLQREFELTKTQIGMHSTFFFLANMLTGILCGRLIDIKGAKWGLFYGVLALCVLTMLHALIPNFIILLILAVFTGITVSINMPAANKALSEWFPKNLRATAIGLVSTAFPIGGIIAASTLPFLGNSIGWRKAIIFPGIFALICALIIKKFYHLF